MKYMLNDIRVVTVGDPMEFNCAHNPGDGFECRGENLYFNEHTKQFSHFVLATLMPYIAAKQRAGDPNDWMQYEQDIACPDPQCSARFRFSVVERREYEYSSIADGKKV